MKKIEKENWKRYENQEYVISFFMDKNFTQNLEYTYFLDASMDE